MRYLSLNEHSQPRSVALLQSLYSTALSDLRLAISIEQNRLVREPIPTKPQKNSPSLKPQSTRDDERTPAEERVQ